MWFWSLFILSVAVLAAGPAGASPAITTKEPFEELLFNPCTDEPEWLLAEGEIHMTSQFSLSPDGRSHVTVETNLANTRGFGLVSGARYNVQRILAEHTNASSDFAPFNTQSNFLEHYIRQAEDGSPVEDDDFFLWTRLHTTVNAAGIPTPERIEFDFECR